MIPARIALPSTDFAAEQAVLGACLLAAEFAAQDAAYQEVVARTIARLSDTDFHTETYRTIYGAIAARHEWGAPIGAEFIAHDLRGDDPGLVSGALLACVENATVPALLDGYLDRVLVAARTRHTEARLRVALDRLHDGDALDAVTTTLVDDLAALVDRGAERPRATAARSVGAVVREVYAKLDEQETDFVPTPFPELTDRLGGGLLRGELVYMKGPAAAAKTAAAIQWAALAATAGHPTLVVSREMAATAIARRFIAQQLHVPAGALRRRQVHAHDRARIADALERFDALPLVFDDGTETIGGILRAVKRGGYRFVVVDYVQLVTSPADSKDERRELEAVSKGLKRLAMRGCSVLALSAVTRLPQDGRSKKERPSYQLRGSERLQHDADVVLTIYRPTEDSQDRVLLYDKLREGESGGARTLEFSTTYLTFDQVDDTTPAWVRGKD